VRVGSDPDDDIFLECLQDARAHSLVTGKIKHFPLNWADALIVTARQVVDAFADIEEQTR
jgi:predicted nucleic acid-binding protein